jgi:hypothetical protein
MTKIQHFLSHISCIPSVSILFHPRRTRQPKLAREMCMALSAFILPLSRLHCDSISIQHGYSALEEGQLDDKFFIDAYIASLCLGPSPPPRMAASNVVKLNLSTELFHARRLLDWCLSFSQNSHTETLSVSHGALTEMPRYNEFFPDLSLPSLQHLYIRGFMPMLELLALLSRHPGVSTIKFTRCGHQIEEPLQLHSKLTLHSLLYLTIPGEVVVRFFAIFDLPNLLQLDVHLQADSLGSGHTIFSVLSSYPRLHAIKLELYFLSFLSDCLPPLMVNPARLTNLKNLGLTFPAMMDSKNTLVSYQFLFVPSKSS